MKPFLNWAGGKRWLVSNYGQLLNHPSKRFVEPFLGSGAVYFHVKPNEAILSDMNQELIETYIAVRDEPDCVLHALQLHQGSHCKAHYYEVRSSKPRTSAGRAAKLIYLNRTCFNGLYRVNLNGEFNVPKGSKSAVLLPDDDFFAWSKLLKGACLLAQDFQLTLDGVAAGDVVYVDPPYTVKHNMNNFVKYNEHIFSWADQVRLSDCLQAVTQKGARVIVSNADNPLVLGLYPSGDWTHLTVNRHSRLAASPEHRRPTTEVVIANCLAPNGEAVEPRACVSRTQSVEVSQTSADGSLDPKP